MDFENVHFFCPSPATGTNFHRVETAAARQCQETKKSVFICVPHG
jgi:hypothetical protein